MDKYQNLRIWSYQHPNEALENEYLARFRDVTTLKTGLYLNPIKHGQRSLQTYELFLVPLPKILRLQDEMAQFAQDNKFDQEIAPSSIYAIVQPNFSG